jgi:hypothetical protein
VFTRAHRCSISGRRSARALQLALFRKLKSGRRDQQNNASVIGEVMCAWNWVSRIRAMRHDLPRD